MSTAGFTAKNYIIRTNAIPRGAGVPPTASAVSNLNMAIFRKTTTIPLAVAMTGVKMGDQLVQIGFRDRMLLTDLASKVGFSGRASVVVYHEHEASRARDAAARAGVLVDVEMANRAFPLQSASFDIAVVDNTGGWLGTSAPETRVSALQETLRVLRPGGRCIVVEAASRGGILGALGRRKEDPHFAASGGTEAALKAEGFAGVRVLTEREGRRFVEGTKRVS